jgi:hypothetical protein
MCEDSDAIPPSITTSVGSVERGDSEEDMLSSSCGRVTLRDDPDPLPAMVHAEYHDRYLPAFLSPLFLLLNKVPNKVLLDGLSMAAISRPPLWLTPFFCISAAARRAQSARGATDHWMMFGTNS